MQKAIHKLGAVIRQQFLLENACFLDQRNLFKSYDCMRGGHAEEFRFLEAHAAVSHPVQIICYFTVRRSADEEPANITDITVIFVLGVWFVLDADGIPYLQQNVSNGDPETSQRFFAKRRSVH